MTGRLRDYNFKISYGASDDRLHDFYIPALSRSVHYDRSAGFFSSSALAVASAGLARLVENGGKMRLLVGADLSEKDVEAIAKGCELNEVVDGWLVDALREPEEELMRRRLEVLAWMVAAGTLEIKVVLPTGSDGLPLSASQSSAYFHIKDGVFTDAQGDQVAFSGSVNESQTAWKHNYEEFSVYCSWDAGRPWLAQVVHRFDRLWTGREPDWIAIDIPEAARKKLLKYRPDAPPRRDPLEREPKEKEPPVEVIKPVEPVELQRERMLFQFVRDAPYMPDATQLGAVTCALNPWPHQTRVADAIVARFPERFLLCDEVGLGKTIEAGLAIRQLIISGRVRRCLLLVPKSVARQWQEELYEKFVLNVPFYDGHTFHDVFGEEMTPQFSNPWDAFDVMIASSQLAKRRERRSRLLEARDWDLVVVDEAHHARRRDFLRLDYYRPNRLLELLNDLKDRTKGLLLMTATPMQVAPVEVWDLLKLLGMGGRWGASEEGFLEFFRQVRSPNDNTDWDFVFGMTRDFLDAGGELDPLFAEQARQKLGVVDWSQVESLPHSTGRAGKIKRLPQQARAVTVEMARRHTPLKRFMFRNTRSLLREYAKRGILKDRVPRRRPDLVWTKMSREEKELYGRIEEYIGSFYQKYEEERKGLGFVMTVYRRRLTSSFYAIRRSLERRLAFLRGQALPGTVAGMDDDDLEQEDLSADITEDLDAEERSRFKDEVEYVEDFLSGLKSMSDVDSKVARLKDDLDAIFKTRRTVIVFTQYADTMDFLREQLRQVYGSQVACYSGRGGEYWNGIAWVQTTKEQIKNDFREGEEVKILVCTEAASEGLNLQTCGVLINYDMPWNPMRVEQRIGRIDRIGQEHDVVRIYNYFYEDTVEAKVYRALQDRISWFEDVVGELQPILAGVEQAIKAVAMAPAQERQKLLNDEIERLRREIDTKQGELLNLDEYTEKGEPPEGVSAPVSLADLERLLTGSATFGERFQPHPELAGAYLLEVDDGDVAVTFDPALFDEHPNTLRLLSYGSSLLADLLTDIEEPEMSPESGMLLRCSAELPIPLRVHYVLKDGRPHRLQSESEFQEALDTRAEGHVWTQEALDAAHADFEKERKRLQEKMAEVLEARHRAERMALEEQARRLLVCAALVELAMGQQPDVFGEETLPVSFNEAAIDGLRRHKYPFAPLFQLVDTKGLRPGPTDQFFGKVQGKPRDVLKRQFAAIKEEAQSLVSKLTSVETKSIEVTGNAVCQLYRFTGGRQERNKKVS